MQGAINNHNSNYASNYNNSNHQQQQQPMSQETREAVKYKVLQASKVVVSVRESIQIVEDILRAGHPVGLDGEGVNLGPKGQLTLVQVSTVSGQVIIFDVQTTPALMTQGGLQKLLESEQIIKVSWYMQQHLYTKSINYY